MTFVSELEPRALWGHFDRILEIPRGSKEEDAIRDYVVGVAKGAGLDHQVDAAGNVVVRKPGTAGREDGGVTVLQSHLDMVNEKNADVDHDFSRDPIQPARDGDYLKAKGTTLGSDNGIGVAAMLAVMEADDLEHGPLEFLFTVDEETGLTGAAELDPSLLEGRRLLNLDTEEEGAVYVGCAGGGDTQLTLLVRREAAGEDGTAVRIRLRGLKGGHSGVDIHLQRGNAVRLLARILDAGARGRGFRLASLQGGNKHNAIPREAEATVVVGAEDVEAFRKAVQDEFSAVRTAFGATEPNMEIAVESGEAPDGALDPASSWRALHLLHALPHGVLAMSRDIPDLVETSTNLAAARLDGEELTVLMSTRSSVMSELHAVRGRIRALAHLAGVEVSEETPYPGWQPDLESDVLKVVEAVHTEALGREPEVKAVHAGLETGIIGEKVPGMDMVSFGPQIEYPHSPDERVRIPSVAEFYRLLTRTLARLD
jgi:dipeptidase D